MTIGLVVAKQSVSLSACNSVRQSTRIYRLLRRDSHDDGSITKGFCGFFHHRNNRALISQLITDISTSLTFSLIL